METGDKMHLYLPTSGKLYMDEKANGVVLATALQTRGYLQPPKEEMWLKEIRVEGLPMQVRKEERRNIVEGHIKLSSLSVCNTNFLKASSTCLERIHNT